MTSHDLIFVIYFCRITKNVSIYNYCLSEDLKYMDINQENKIYRLSYQRVQKLFRQYSYHSKTYIYADQKHLLSLFDIRIVYSIDPISYFSE